MNAHEMQRYEHLWSRTDPNWVLLRAPELPGGYCVFNKLGHILLIESNEINEEVCKRMKAAGCEAVETVPKVQIAASPVKE